MMLALVAGTLRTYCREQVLSLSLFFNMVNLSFQGIKHPPDVGCFVPVSCRNFLPIACGYPCDVLSYPLQLPVGVEGTVPRVWAVQKRLLDGLNGHIPAALKMAQVFCMYKLLWSNGCIQLGSVLPRTLPQNGWSHFLAQTRSMWPFTGRREILR